MHQDPQHLSTFVACRPLGPFMCILQLTTIGVQLKVFLNPPHGFGYSCGFQQPLLDRPREKEHKRNDMLHAAMRPGFS